MRKVFNTIAIAALFVLTSSFTNQATLKEKICNQKWKLVKTIIGDGEDAFEVPAESVQLIEFKSDFTYADKSIADNSENVNFSSKWELIESEKSFKLYLDESLEEFAEAHIGQLDDKTFHFEYELDDKLQFFYEAY